MAIFIVQHQVDTVVFCRDDIRHPYVKATTKKHHTVTKANNYCYSMITHKLSKKHCNVSYGYLDLDATSRDLKMRTYF